MTDPRPAELPPTSLAELIPPVPVMCALPANELAALRAALAELLVAGALVCASIEHKSVNWGEKPDAARLLKALEQGREALSR